MLPADEEILSIQLVTKYARQSALVCGGLKYDKTHLGVLLIYFLFEVCTNESPVSTHTFLYLLLRKYVITNCKVCETGYTSKNAQVVTTLQQTCSNVVPTTCQQDVFTLLVPSLFTSCQRLVDNLLQVVPTTCYRPAIQQFVNKL
jgi:hypothetical protein